MKKEFVGRDFSRAKRKALDFWYKNFYGKYSLIDFIEKCSWKRVENKYIVIYRGPTPE